MDLSIENFIFLKIDEVNRILFGGMSVLKRWVGCGCVCNVDLGGN
jgi:hypothetical protein